MGASHCPLMRSFERAFVWDPQLYKSEVNRNYIHSNFRSTGRKSSYMTKEQRRTCVKLVCWLSCKWQRKRRHVSSSFGSKNQWRKNVFVGFETHKCQAFSCKSCKLPDFRKLPSSLSNCIWILLKNEKHVNIRKNLLRLFLVCIALCFYERSYVTKFC